MIIYKRNVLEIFMVKKLSAFRMIFGIFLIVLGVIRFIFTDTSGNIIYYSWGKFSWISCT
jgi:hypothetical protein